MVTTVAECYVPSCRGPQSSVCTPTGPNHPGRRHRAALTRDNWRPVVWRPSSRSDARVPAGSRSSAIGRPSGSSARSLVSARRSSPRLLSRARRWAARIRLAPVLPVRHYRGHEGHTRPPPGPEPSRSPGPGDLQKRGPVVLRNLGKVPESETQRCAVLRERISLAVLWR